jgi:hypothetical protein
MIGTKLQSQRLRTGSCISTKYTKLLCTSNAQIVDTLMATRWILEASRRSPTPRLTLAFQTKHPLCMICFESSSINYKPVPSSWASLVSFTSVPENLSFPSFSSAYSNKTILLYSLSYTFQSILFLLVISLAQQGYFLMVPGLPNHHLFET